MKASLVIQAGGKSSRMGSNKALLKFKGQPLILRIIQRLNLLAEEMIIISNQPDDLAFLGLPVYPDLYPGKGPLAGLFTGLFYSRQPIVAIIATDMPFPNQALFLRQIELLVREKMDVVIPASEEGLEPFHAIYRRDACLAAVKKALENDQKRMISWFPDVKVLEVPFVDVCRYDKNGRLFTNINTCEELIQAELLEDGLSG